MSSWLKKPKATTVPPPIYNKTPELMAGAQKYLGAGYEQGVQDRNKQYSGAGTLANSLLSRANEDMALGGDLDTETKNELTRNVFGLSGLSGFTRFGSSPQTESDWVRNLGLKRLDLKNQRTQQGQNILNMREFVPPNYGSSLANAFLQSEMGNTQLGNDWVDSQLAANEAVKGQDSFLGSLGKYAVKRGVDTAFDTAGAAAKGAASSGGM